MEAMLRNRRSDALTPMGVEDVEDKEFLHKGERVFLTFDDGPNEPYTSQILDILGSAQVKASFFTCGKNVEYYPNVARRIVNEGHIIGNHAYSHLRLLSLAGLLAKEIEKTTEIIQEITGVRTKFFRPPFGMLTPWLIFYLRRHGYKLILWDVIAYDWRQPPSEIIAKRVIKKVRSNSIILLHDGYDTRHNSDRSQTVGAVPLIIEGLEKKGYIFETIDKIVPSSK